MTCDARRRFLLGVRAGLPFAAAGLLLSASFGVLAREAGMPAAAAIAMSAIVFAGSAQFASLAIITGGGSVAAAVATGALINARFLPMGIAIAPSLPGGALRRALQGQAIVDASWALSNRGDGTFDRWALFGSTAPQYVTWTIGTVLGVAFGGALPDPSDLGLDALFPAFFLALLIGELRTPRARAVALAAGLIALALVSVTPAGVPVLAASLAAVAGARRRAAA